jgi:hypothetical protein
MRTSPIPRSLDYIRTDDGLQKIVPNDIIWKNVIIIDRNGEKVPRSQSLIRRPADRDVW